MTTILRLTTSLLLLSACAPRSTAMVCDPATNTCRDANGWDGLAPLERFEHLDQVTPVDGIEVTGSPDGPAGWLLTIRNTTDEPITFVVEDSTFAFSVGKEVSRLIRGETKRLDVHRPQPPAPIAARATWTGVVRVSKLLLAEDFERKARENEEKIQRSSDTEWQKRTVAQLEDLVRRQRADVARFVIGGTLSLVLQRPSGTQTWTGTVAGMLPARDRGR